ncbi:MAG: hypothetical protein DRH04_10760 [Deltaproteobacteria bacterium]|nr:MAG: hypothetical protein DRH04_10760 [Deltaproteobacteria bacterium]
MAGSITTLGLGSGLDLQNILEQLKAADRIPIGIMEARQLEYKTQLEEFNTVNTKLLALKNAAFSLSLNDTFDTKSASSNNDSVLNATSSSNAIAGTYEINVSTLAKKNSWQSSGVAGKSSVIATAASDFTYTVNGQQSTVAVTTDMTLEELASAINDDPGNPGVTATVMDDGSGGGDAFHLVLVSNETGEDNALTIDTNNTDLTFNEIQASGTLNAQFTVNGISYQRSSNTIEDVITGLTFDLVDLGSATVKVTADTESVSEKIAALVEAYNDAIAEIEANSGYNTETRVSGTLNGLSVITGIKSKLNTTMFGQINGLAGSFNSLGEIGLEFNRDGTISINEAQLASTLDENPDSVKEIFVGNTDETIDGVATLLNDQLRFLTKTSGGLIANEKVRVQSTVDRLDKRIDIATERLDKRYDTMTRLFVQLDQMMSSLQSESSYLSNQFESLSNLFSNNN